MNRRRFLTIAAGLAAYPAFAAAPLRWRGMALGAQARLDLTGPDHITRPALDAALAVLRRAERLFSLYDPGSTLLALNRDEALVAAPEPFLTLLDQVDHIHRLTGGRFDPTIQPVWAALAHGAIGDEWDLVGWDRVQRDGGHIRLAARQQLTLNGIAQGFATDLVADALRRHGLADAFVDIGEQRAWGDPRRLALVDPAHGDVGSMTLRDGALATSSPAATPLGATGHILDPKGLSQPIWSSVTVEADTAALADGLSTALCLSPLSEVARVRDQAGLRRVVLVDPAGNVRSL